METQEGDGINTPYFEKDGISYWLLTQKYSEEARIIVCDCFAAGEVLFNLSPIEQNEIRAFFTIIWPEAVDNGLSVVAVDVATGKVVGAFTGFDEAI